MEYVPPVELGVVLRAGEDDSAPLRLGAGVLEPLHGDHVGCREQFSANLIGRLRAIREGEQVRPVLLKQAAEEYVERVRGRLDGEE